MTVSAASLPSVIAARVALAEAALFKAGQTLQALVVGKTSSGLTQLKIGDVLVQAALPQAAPVGTTLQLQVKAGGATPQMVVVSQTPPAGQGVVAAPLPGGLARPPLPQIVPPRPAQQSNSAASAQVPGPTKATGAPVAPVGWAFEDGAQGAVEQAPPRQPGVAQGAPAAPGRPSGSSGQPTVPQSQSAARPIAGAQQVEPERQTAVSLPAAAATGPREVAARPVIAATGPLPATPASTGAGGAARPETVPAALPAEPEAASAPAAKAEVGQGLAPNASRGDSSARAPVQPSTLAMARPGEAVTDAPPQPHASAPEVPAARSVSRPLTQPSVPEAARPQGAVAVPGTQAQPGVQSQQSTVSATTRSAAGPPAVSQQVAGAMPATVPAPPNAGQAEVLGLARGQPISPEGPVVAAPVQGGGAPQALVGPRDEARPPVAASATPASAPASEAETPNPLLLAQSAPRTTATMADLPRLAQAAAQPGSAAPPAAAAQPATPQAALAQMVPEALAKQDSMAPLLANLAALVGKPGLLPAPVLQAALQLLAQRVVLPRNPSGETVRTALAGSGVLLETLLSQGIAQPDVKSALVALKATLATWAGPGAAPAAGADRATPPLRGVPPRLDAPEQLAVPDTPRDAARVLHGQADAALSRVKLMQLASLPDAAPAPARQPEIRMEVPFLLGQELVMAQFQVSRDAPQNSRSDRKRGWTMRFAMRFAASGEVGAEIGLLGKSVNVAIWADDAEMAERLTAMLPELSQSLQAIGLAPGAIRWRGVPEPARPVSGHFLDALS